MLVRDRGGAVFPNIIKGPSRRSLLQGVGCAIAVSPSVAFAAANPVSPAMAKLSAYMSEAGDRALPDDVVEKAKHHILDTFAAMVSGSELPPAPRGATRSPAAIPRRLRDGRRLNDDLRSDRRGARQRHAGAFGRDRRLQRVLAVASRLRRSCRRLSRLGEKFGIDGTRFLRAVTLGYDVGPRVTISSARSPFRDTSHKSTHAIAGMFGAAAAAACAAGLDAQQMRWLLDYTAQHRRASAHGGATPITSRRRSCSAACRHATASPRRCWFTSGWTGVDDVFSGAGQLLPGVCARTATRTSWSTQLGERYEIVRTNIKKWTRRLADPGAARCDRATSCGKRAVRRRTR